MRYDAPPRGPVAPAFASRKDDHTRSQWSTRSTVSMKNATS